MFITHSIYPTMIEESSTLRIMIFDDYLTTYIYIYIYIYIYYIYISMII